MSSRLNDEPPVNILRSHRDLDESVYWLSRGLATHALEAGHPETSIYRAVSGRNMRWYCESRKHAMGIVHNDTKPSMSISGDPVGPRETSRGSMPAWTACLRVLPELLPVSWESARGRSQPQRPPLP